MSQCTLDGIESPYKDLNILGSALGAARSDALRRPRTVQSELAVMDK